MFNVTIIFGVKPTPLTLTYRKLGDALIVGGRFEEASKTGEQFEVTDDFGQIAKLNPPLQACVIEDLDAGVAAAVERAIVQTRAQAQAQIAIRNDPTIRSAAFSQGQGLVGVPGAVGGRPTF